LPYEQSSHSWSLAGPLGANGADAERMEHVNGMFVLDLAEGWSEAEQGFGPSPHNGCKDGTALYVYTLLRVVLVSPAGTSLPVTLERQLHYND
jgi:hypothetical protein